MNEVEYALKIVLRVRDELAAGLAKARTELAGFKREVNSMFKPVDDINKALKDFDGHLGSLTKKLEDWRNTLGNTNKDTKDVSKSIDVLGKNADATSAKIVRAAKSTEEMNKAARELRREFYELTKQEQINDKNRAYTVLKLKELGRAFDTLAKKVDDPTLGKFWANYAKEAKDAAKSIDDDYKALIKTQEEYEKSIAKAMDRTKVAGTTQRELGKSIQALHAEYKKLNAAEKEGAVDREYALKGYQLLGNQIDALFKKITIGTRESQRAFRRAADVKSGIDDILKAQRAEVDGARKASKLLEEIREELERGHQKTAKERAEFDEKEATARVNRLVAVDKEIEAEAKRHAAEQERLQAETDKKDADAAKNRANLLEGIYDELERDKRQRAIDDAKWEQAEAQERLRRLNANDKEYEQEAKAHNRELEKIGEDRLAFQQEEARLAARLGAIRERGRAGKLDTGDAEELRQIAKDYDRLAASVKNNHDEFRRFATIASRVRSALASMGSESDRTRGRFGSLGKALRDSSDNVATLDNRLRGILLLAVASFAEQLITAVAALGGELVALAGSAAMAGAALGGILAAGAAQALPVVGLLAGAMSRVNSVLEAHQQAQKLEQAQFTDAEKGRQKQIDQTNALANAQDQVTAANERLAESRKDLTKAQKDGERQLQDLILAEKEAALAAQGASLNVKDAQKALADAIKSGASALEVQQRQQALDEAKLGKQKAGIGARRAGEDVAAVGGDIGNLDSVRNAQKAVKDSQRAVEQAGRGLDQAGDKADRAAATTMTAAATLNYLLSQMSPAERKLYTAVERIHKHYQKIFIGDKKKSGIYGTIISAFADAVNAVDRVMRMPKVIRTLTSLAREIGRQIRKVTEFLTRGEELEQFIEITKDAKDNLGPLVDIVLDLVDAFTNIAVAANPAFEKLLEYVGPIIDKFTGITENKGAMEDFFLKGEEHLESWLDLFGAIGGLLGALFGASADTGKQGVEELTTTIKGWTDWIEDHHDQVVGFFEDSYEVVKQIGEVLEVVGVEIAKIFTPEHLEQFANFMEDTLIPAISGVIQTLGEVTDKILAIVNTDIGSFLVKFGLMALIFGTIATSALGAIGYIGNMIKHFTDLGKAAASFATGGKKAKDALDALDDDDDDDKKKKRRKRKQRPTPKPAPAPAPTPGGDEDDDDGKKKGLFGKLKGFGGRAAPAAAGGAAAAGAPAAAGAAAGAAVPLAIAAAVLVAVGAVVLLLDHFKKLDDIWRAVQDTFNDFLKDIEPGIKTVQDALKDLGVEVDSVQDIIDGVWKSLEGLAEFITVYIIENLKGLGDILAGIFLAVSYAVAGVINIIHGVVDVLIGLFKIIKGVFSGDPEAMKEGFNQILDGFEELVEGIIEIIGGIIIGLIKVFEGVLEVVLAPFKAAWAAVKKWFGIDSPSKKAIELGEAILNGIKDGLKGLLRILTWPFRQAWNGIKRIFGAEKVEKLAEDIIDFFAKGLRSGAEAVKRAATWVWGRIKEAFEAAKNFGGTIITAIIDGIKSLPGKMLEAVTTIGKDLLAVGEKIGGFVVDGIKKVVETAKKFIPFWGDDEDKDGKKPAGGAAPKPAAAPAPIFKLDVGAGLIPFGAKDLKDAENIYGKFWQELRRDARNSTDYIQRQFREMRIATTQSSDKMYKDIRGSLADIQNSFKTRGGIIGDTWSDRWHNIDKVAYDGLNYIAQQTNKMLKGLSEKTISFALAAPKKEDKATGGFIGKPGQRGTDKGLYALGNGEAVLNWAHQRYIAPAVEAFYGHPFEATFDRVHAFHAGGYGQPGMAGGGMVQIPNQPKGELIHSSIVNDVVALAKRYKLLVTDGYAMSGHAADGEHPKGLAIDAIPGPGSNGSWGLINQLAAWAEPRQNQPRSPFRWVGYNGDANHGEGDHIHLSWLAGKTLGATADLVTSIAKRLVQGPDGGFKTILSSAIEMARKVANKFIDEKSAYTDPEGTEPGAKYPKGALSQGQIESTIKRALNILDITTNVAMWIKAVTRQASRESTFDPNAQNKTPAGVAAGGPKGLMQVVDGTFAAYKHPGHDNVFNPLDNILAAIRYVVARYGGGNSDQGANVLWARGGGAYAEGGIIPGGEGMPVPILAHAGEWVLNKSQQLRAAILAGVSVTGLRSVLGFHGGPEGAAGGTEVKTRFGKVDVPAPTAAVDRAMKRGLAAYAAMLKEIEEAWDKVDAASRTIARHRTDKKTGKIVRAYQRAVDAIDKLTADNGVIDTMTNEIARQAAKAALKIQTQTYRIKGGKVFKKLSEMEILTKQLEDLGRNYNDLLGERGVVHDGLVGVNKQIKKIKNDKKLTKAQKTKLLNQLDSQRTDLITSLDDLDQQIADSVQARYEAQEAIKQQLIDDINKSVEAVNKVAQQKATELDLAKRIATAMGGSVTQINNDIQANLAKQQADLMAEYEKAKAKGADADTLQEIKNQADELGVQIKELVAQKFQDSIDAINKDATRALGKLDLYQRMADAVGTITGAVGIPGLGAKVMSRADIGTERGQVLTQQRGQLAGKYDEALMTGNTTKMEELGDQIAELDVAIAENTRSVREAKKEEQQATFDYEMSMNDLRMQLLESKDAISGLTSTTDKKTLLDQRTTLLSQRHTELLQQIQDTPSGDEKALRELNKQLLENEIATNQNTKALKDLTGEGSAPQTFSSTVWDWFGRAFFGGTGKVTPEYDLPGMSSMPFTGGAGDVGINSSTNNSTGDTNIYVEVNEAGQPIDPTRVASTIGFAQATAP